MFMIPVSQILQECRQKWCIFALCIIFSAGCGAVFADSAGDVYVALMRMAVSRPASIVGLVVSYAVPCIAFLYAVVRSKRWLVYLICALHVFRFSSVGWAVQKSFGSAVWLIRLLMQFSDLFLIPTLIFFSLKFLIGAFSRRYLLIFIVISAVVGMVYYCLISPFLANLMDTYETMGRYAIHVGLDRCL